MADAIEKLIYAAKQACVDMGETTNALALYETIAPAEQENARLTAALERVKGALREVDATLSYYNDADARCYKGCNCDRCAARRLIEAALAEARHD